MIRSHSLSTASPGAVGLPRFRFRATPIGLSSITTAFYYKLMFAPALCPVSAKDSSFSVWPVRTGPNRDSALHSNFPKQYAATSAEAKKAAAQNHACPLSSYLTQRVATTPLPRATMLAPTSKAK
jgi:hypothetical protein